MFDLHEIIFRVRSTEEILTEASENNARGLYCEALTVLDTIGSRKLTTDEITRLNVLRCVAARELDRVCLEHGGF